MVTYERARRWLAKIGGVTIEGERQITVSVVSARGPVVQGHARFDGALEGVQREPAVRAAFVHACSALKDALG